MINSYRQIYVEQHGKLSLSQVTFESNDQLMQVIDRIVSTIGRRVDELSPMVDARLKDGSRVNVIIPPLALRGPTVTIRKFAKEAFTVEDLVNFGSVTDDMVRYLRACVRGRLNVVVSGGTGSGKTTTLNILSSFIPEDERIVTIEDAAELQLRQEHVVTLETRPANIEGRGRGHHPRAGDQLPAHAPRPHRRRRVPRRRGPGHAPGDEHRPRRLADHPARQQRHASASAVSRRWC